MIAYRKTDDASLRLVDAYMRDIRDSEPLDRKEEAELARQTRNGDELARQRLITANLRFVVSVARDFCGRGLSMSELISEGNLGLLEAAGRFDETRGLKFITYGVWWIRQAILKALAENGSAARPPLSWIEGRRKIGREMARLTQELGREPTNSPSAPTSTLAGSTEHWRQGSRMSASTPPFLRMAKKLGAMYRSSRKRHRLKSSSTPNS